MFDHHVPQDWVNAMKIWNDFDVEFYFCGGEPFVLEGTYDIVKEFASMPHVKWARIDHNMTKIEEILERCRSSKVKLLCSWHAYRMKFDDALDNANKLYAADMLGMVNFVASRENLKAITKLGLDLDYLVRSFYDRGVFLNIAADFNMKDNPAYLEMVNRYTSPEDWDNLRGKIPCLGARCGASKHYYTVEHDGTIITCAHNKKVGNFFDGTLIREESLCGFQGPESCTCIISYCHRLDNPFSPVRHLEDYIKRNTAYRKNVGII